MTWTQEHIWEPWAEALDGSEGQMICAVLLVAVCVIVGIIGWVFLTGLMFGVSLLVGWVWFVGCVYRLVRLLWKIATKETA